MNIQAAEALLRRQRRNRQNKPSSSSKPTAKNNSNSNSNSDHVHGAHCNHKRDTNTTTKSKSSSKSKSVPAPAPAPNTIPIEKRRPPKIKYAALEYVFMYASLFITILEVLCWLILPYPISSHSNKNPMWTLIVSALLNSVPHFYCGTMALISIKTTFHVQRFYVQLKLEYKQEIERFLRSHQMGGTGTGNTLNQKEYTDKLNAIAAEYDQVLGSVKVPRVGGLRFTLYALYIHLFALMQLYFWWLPYFFGMITDERLQRMSVKLRKVVRILRDQSDDGFLTPSLEHTILFPVTLIALMSTYIMYFKYRYLIVAQLRRKYLNFAILFSCALLFCYLPASMALFATTEAADPGIIIIATAMICAAFLVFAMIFWTIPEIRALEQKKVEKMKRMRKRAK